MKIDDVYEFDGVKPGPTVAIFAGVHGNERAGVYALKELIETLTIKSGKVFLVFANPPAIKSNVRMLEKNLNRCFYKGNDGNAWEDVRARQLMSLLDKCDALLDLHMFYDEGEPFIICENDSIEIAKIFDVSIISTNWTEVEPGGTDGYMHKMGKVGICLECGPISKSKECAPYAKNAVYQLLAYYKIIEEDIKHSSIDKTIVKAEKAIYKSSNAFKLLPGFKNFDQLSEGQVIAKDGDISLVANKNQCIIFPHYNARVDEEAYIIGRVV